ncbi:hypothetical protein FSP39_020685 [Pinctada imbricata]|uniref:Kidney mitochondrial carrier protein 1 n=1 Tax=Pinctada imbricata TaxID=66713 RepID=A0AA89BVE9_PINIB|nr:hypothetical protein FSP39_020685 [Pinctada imbricata]
MSDWRPFLYGGFASIAAEFGTFPIDTTKTRLQVQGQQFDVHLAQIKYRGMVHALYRILKEEGYLALYSGIAPALLRQATYGTIKIGVYHSMKGIFVSDPRDETLPVNILCGIVAGVVSSCIANPTDVLKVRLQAQCQQADRTSMLRAFIQIYKQEGVGGLWRGVGPTAQRAATVAGVMLPAYDVFKKYIILSGVLEDTKETHFLASFCAGVIGAVFSTPIDVAKTRMMNQRKLKAATLQHGHGANTVLLYRSSLDCLSRTVKTEGLSAIYKGFVPTWFRLGPWNIIFFMTYEQLKRIY